jgi:hypothetical protein
MIILASCSFSNKREYAEHFENSTQQRQERFFLKKAQEHRLISDKIEG